LVGLQYEYVSKLRYGLPISCSVKGRGKKRAKKEDKHKKEGLDQQESSTQEAFF